MAGVETSETDIANEGLFCIDGRLKSAFSCHEGFLSILEPGVGGEGEGIGLPPSVLLDCDCTRCNLSVMDEKKGDDRNGVGDEWMKVAKGNGTSLSIECPKKEFNQMIWVKLVFMSQSN